MGTGEALCNTLFITAFVLTTFSFSILCIRPFSGSQVKKPDKTTHPHVLVTLAMVVWFLLWISLARGAKRHDFFIGLPLAYGTVWILYFFPTHLIQWLKDVKIVYPHITGKRVTTFFAVIVFITVLFWTPFGGHATRSIYAAARMRTSIPGEGSETDALHWMKKTLPPDSVIAANWQYGNRINVLGGVKTITDPDHYLPHWIHLYYRHVFCAKSEQEALEFLKTHGATHLMLSEHRILSNAGSYSFIGSNEESDRWFEKITSFILKYPLSVHHTDGYPRKR